MKVKGGRRYFLHQKHRFRSGLLALFSFYQNNDLYAYASRGPAEGSPLRERELMQTLSSGRLTLELPGKRKNGP
ncbi:hypothetical protein SBA5_80077 [Candidatus Sulfotelmatomonas gaucii]|uniref:Uncharacterized protein n=1 Tax=Candidatus Sulfuritelmatomonas gaucii TaxID=2043161 RepID=A0A2N9M5G9_9BACT|nr:hypothetical protein SBA5_80077 [Candidatus Sulfotelmatomonas gaucii]